MLFKIIWQITLFVSIMLIVLTNGSPKFVPHNFTRNHPAILQRNNLEKVTECLYIAVSLSYNKKK